MFSAKSLMALDDKYYVYGLIDPEDGKVFYVGKGKNNRVFDHENTSLNTPDRTSSKLDKIAKIRASGKTVEKVLFNWGLTEEEAYAAEAALINALNYLENPTGAFSTMLLTNIQSGHHCTQALSVEDFERIYGAYELDANDIKHNVMVVKLNQTYNRNLTEKEIYDITRGNWIMSEEKTKWVRYVFAVYCSLIVGVYKPSRWFRCKDAGNINPWLPLKPKDANKYCFVDDDFVNNGYKQQDACANAYLWKSLVKIPKQSATKQRPNYYLE